MQLLKLQKSVDQITSIVFVLWINIKKHKEKNMNIALLATNA